MSYPADSTYFISIILVY